MPEEFPGQLVVSLRSVWGFVHGDAGFTDASFFGTPPFKNLLKQLGKTASAEEIMSGLADGAVVRPATFREPAPTRNKGLASNGILFTSPAGMVQRGLVHLEGLPAALSAVARPPSVALLEAAVQELAAWAIASLDLSSLEVPHLRKLLIQSELDPFG